MTDATERETDRGPSWDVLSGTEGVKTVVDGVHVLPAQGNAMAIETGAGVVLVDSGNGGDVTQRMIDALRGLTDAPVHAICYSHGHVGYNSGAPMWAAEAEARGDPPPRLIAHRNVVARHDRYRETLGLQMTLGAMQFPNPPPITSNPFDLTDPTETFDDSLTVTEEGRRVDVLWAPSETDDVIAVHLPDDRVVFGGAATPGSSIPNIGTPLRTLRLTTRWADSLDRLAGLGGEALVQEFGPVVEGADVVRNQLTETARALRWLRDEVVERMNRGMTDVEIIHDLEYPPELFDQPWMAPTYGAPDYIVRDLYRQENGWWDRNPTTLHPAHPDAAAEAVLSAITDRRRVLDRARELAEEGQPQLALHVVDLLAQAAGDDAELAEARQLKAELCDARADEIDPYVSRALYHSSARLLEAGRRRWAER